ncbi:MAG TPA: pilus assembly protein TadG-related protein [Terriglobia bacterium]|nr:pilus assembly protein TadG-related protein [Terriglobia bacterium]
MSILVVLAVGLFLIMFVGFGVDMTNLFLHRQMAQNAADAACVAAGMDIYVNRTKGPAGANGCSDVGGNQYNCGGKNYTVGTSFSCQGLSATTPVTSSSGNVAACAYAALNGYTSPSATIPGPGVESNSVQVSFPAAVPGVTTPPANLTGPAPFVQVDVYDGVRVYFSSWLGSSNTQVVHALAKCGLQNQSQPVPIIVLDPSCPHAFEVSGSAQVAVIGGPSKSIQVNSNNKTCAAATTSGGGQCDGSGSVDLSLGGPKFTGSDFGVFGLPNSGTCGGAGPPCSFNGGTTGAWISPAAPIADPWAFLVPPTTTGLQKNPTPLAVTYNGGVNGCPDHGGCTEYTPGWYTTPISVKGSTAIFDPGIYYITGSTNGNCGSPGTGCLGKSKPTGSCNYGLYVDSNGVVRPGLPTKGDGSGGTLFYFTSATGKAGSYESVFFGADAGKAGGRTIDTLPLASLACPGQPAPTSTPKKPLPATFAGNVMTGPCTTSSNGVNYGVTDVNGNIYHGMLMWDDRANADLNGQPSMQGGGGLVLAGNLYFHNCPASPTCADPLTDYNAFFQLQGTPGSSTFVFGDITTDELVLGGNGEIDMQLNPNLVLNILKVALLQ